MTIGRTHQLATLQQFIGRAHREHDAPNTALVTGEAGIGKTTLLGALADKLLSGPTPPTVLTATCSTPLGGHDIGAVEALAPWIAVVTQMAEGTTGERLKGKTLIGRLAMAWVRCIPVVGDVLESAADTAKIITERKQGAVAPTSSSARDQDQMFRQLVNLMAEVARAEPLVILLDDMHWADASSTNMLFTAARELRAAPVAFVVGYRADEAEAVRDGEGHPIVKIAAELARYRLVERIEVPRFDAAALGLLLRARYRDYRPDPDFEEWLAGISAGNALFITQFLATLEEDGRIDRASGAAVKDYRSVEIPDSADAVIRERIRRLDPEARELLRYASVEGERFTASVLAETAGIPTLKLLGRLRRIEEEHGVIRTVGTVRIYAAETTGYRFTHALLQKAMYDGLGAEERALLHDAILTRLLREEEALRNDDRDPSPLAPVIATHAAILGRYDVAADAAMEGAEASWREMAVEETARQARQAIDYIRRVPDRAALHPDLVDMEIKALRCLGRIDRYAGRHEQALALTREARALAESIGERHEIVGCDIDEANSLRYLARYDQAESAARAALELAGSIGYAKGQAGALNALGTIYYPTGRPDEAAASYLKAIDIHREIGEALAEAQTLSNLGNVFKSLGSVEEARRCYERSLDLAASVDNMVSYGVALLHLGNVALHRLEHDEAIAHYEQSAEIGARIGYRELEIRSLSNIAIIHRERGDFAESQALFARVERAAKGWAGPEILIDLYKEMAMLCRSVADANAGRERARALEGAIERLNEAKGLAEKSGMGVEEIVDEIAEIETAMREESSGT